MFVRVCLLPLLFLVTVIGAVIAGVVVGHVVVAFVTTGAFQRVKLCCGTAICWMEGLCFGKSILEYDGLSKGSLSYYSLSGEIIKDE